MSLCRHVRCGGGSEKPDRSPPPYPTPTRGTTVGRDCTTCGLAPPRPIIPPGIPPPMPPIGIGIIGMPPIPAPTPPAVPGISPPSPDIAELASRAGIDPCHVGGTDIDPTSRALPKPDDMADPSPAPPPPSGFIAGAVLPTNLGTSAPAAAALASPAVPAFAPCASDMIGDISMLTGSVAICATDVNDCSGAPETSDCTAAASVGATSPTAEAAAATSAPTWGRQARQVDRRHGKGRQRRRHRHRSGVVADHRGDVLAPHLHILGLRGRDRRRVLAEESSSPPTSSAGPRTAATAAGCTVAVCAASNAVAAARACAAAPSACAADPDSHDTYGTAAPAIASDAGPDHCPPTSAEITESNDDADAEQVGSQPRPTPSPPRPTGPRPPRHTSAPN